jgi:hypothetical protein
MKIKSQFILFFTTFAVWFFSLVLPAAAQEIRTWTSIKGSSIEASLVDTDGTMVRLKRTDGKILALKTTDLAEADRAFLAQNTTNIPIEGESVPVATAGKDTQLPVFTEGEAKGLHALYKCEKYIARVDKAGFMLVTPMESGKELDQLTLRILPDAYTETTPGGLRKQYWIRHFTRSGQPHINPATVSFTGIRDGGITCEVEYGFSNEGITTWFRAETSTESPPGLVHRMRHEFIALKPPEGGDEAQNLFRKQHRAEWKDRSGKKSKANFMEVTTMRGDLEELEVRGPALGKGRVIFTGPKDKAASMMPYQYAETSLAQGFTVYLVKKIPESKNRKDESISVSFR